MSEQTFTAESDAQTATAWRTQTDEQANTRYQELTPRTQRDLRAAITRHEMRIEMEGEWPAHGLTLTVGTSDVVFVIAQGNVYRIESNGHDMRLGTDGTWYDRVPQNLRWFTREQVETVLLDLVRRCTY